METRSVYEMRFGYVRPEEMAARIGDKTVEKYRRRFRDGRSVRPASASFAQSHGRGGGWVCVSFDGDRRIAGAALAGVDRVPIAASFVDLQTREAIAVPSEWEEAARSAVVGAS